MFEWELTRAVTDVDDERSRRESAFAYEVEIWI